MATSNLIAEEVQAAEAALVIFGTLPHLKPPSSSRRASELLGLLHNRYARTTPLDQAEEWGQHLKLQQRPDRSPVNDREVIRRHKVLLLVA